MSAHDADSYNSDLLLKGNLGWIALLVKSTPNSPHKRILVIYDVIHFFYATLYSKID